MSCDLCTDNDEHAPVVGHCTDCEQLLCEHHYVDHKKSRSTRDHEVVLLESEENSDKGGRFLHQFSSSDLKQFVESQSESEGHVSDELYEVKTKKKSASTTKSKSEKANKKERKRILRPLSDVIQHLKTSTDTSHRTFVEMTVHALLTLGGSGTTAQITEFIEKNYSHVLEQRYN